MDTYQPQAPIHGPLVLLLLQTLVPGVGAGLREAEPPCLSLGFFPVGTPGVCLPAHLTPPGARPHPHALFLLHAHTGVDRARSHTHLSVHTSTTEFIHKDPTAWRDSLPSFCPSPLSTRAHPMLLQLAPGCPPSADENGGGHVSLSHLGAKPLRQAITKTARGARFSLDFPPLPPTQIHVARTLPKPALLCSPFLLRVLGPPVYGTWDRVHWLLRGGPQS